MPDDSVTSTATNDIESATPQSLSVGIAHTTWHKYVIAEAESRRQRMACARTHTHTHTYRGTSDCMAKILSSFYTSLSRYWRNGRAEERYPTRRASVLPLQVVERRLGLSWLTGLSLLSWLSSLESEVLARNCTDFLPHLDVTRQQSYRDVQRVNLSMLAFGCGNSRRCWTTQSLPCLKQRHPRYCRSL